MLVHSYGTEELLCAVADDGVKYVERNIRRGIYRDSLK